MKKKHQSGSKKMFKTFLFSFIIMLTAIFTCSAQNYATGGTGSLVKNIFWLDWGTWNATTNNGSPIANGTYTWNITPTMKVTAVISSLSSTKGSAAILEAYNTRFFGGGNNGLDSLYTGANNIGMRNVLPGDTAHFNIAITLTVNGLAVPYPGIVIADAESMNDRTNSFLAGAGPEFITATTNATGFHLLDLYNNSTAANIHGYKLSISNAANTFRLQNDTIGGPTGFGYKDIKQMAVFYAHGATQLNNVSIAGDNYEALAIGFIASFDFGDAPASYGLASHFMNNVTFPGVAIPVGNKYAIDSLVGTPSQSAPVMGGNIYMGASGPADGITKLDADGDGIANQSAAGADNTGSNGDGADEDALTTVPAYYGSGTYSITIPIKNNTVSGTNLAGWIDWNNNGIFDASERVAVALSNTATTATLTWLGLTANPDPGIKYYMRLRISTAALADANTGAPDGEVEDYFLTAITGLPVTLISFNATVQNNCDGVILNWTTASEQSSKSFLVERSTNAQNWTTIATVTAAGNSSSLKTYNYADGTVNNGTYFYRLRQQDIDGREKLSSVVSVKFNCGKNNYYVYPNPVRDVLYIQVPAGTVRQVQVYNGMGQLVKTISITGNSAEIITSSNWAKGMYQVVITENGVIAHTERIVKQ